MNTLILCLFFLRKLGKNNTLAHLTTPSPSLTSTQIVQNCLATSIQRHEFQRIDNADIIQQFQNTKPRRWQCVCNTSPSRICISFKPFLSLSHATLQSAALSTHFNKSKTQNQIILNHTQYLQTLPFFFNSNSITCSIQSTP